MVTPIFGCGKTHLHWNAHRPTRHARSEDLTRLMSSLAGSLRFSRWYQAANSFSLSSEVSSLHLRPDPDHSTKLILISDSQAIPLRGRRGGRWSHKVKHDKHGIVFSSSGPKEVRACQFPNRFTT